jgi:hypothetical protein
MTRPLPQDAERRLLNYERAAAYLGISIRAMKDIGGPHGRIVQVKIGERVLFDKADLDGYIEKLKRAS